MMSNNTSQIVELTGLFAVMSVSAKIKAKAPMSGGYHASDDIAVVDIHAMCEKASPNS